MQSIKIFFHRIKLTIQFLTANFKGFLIIIILALILLPKGEEGFKKPNLAQIDLIGEIHTGLLIDEIEKLIKNRSIKGVLLLVNSPGGDVAASIEISDAIKKLNAVKPVFVYAAGNIASGSYYASIWADKIYANRGSVVGSIGVIFHGMNLADIMQKIGVKSQIVKAGKYKEAGTPDRVWHDYEKKELEKLTQSFYHTFISDVASARHLNLKDAPKFANAHLFTANQAKAVGLIDDTKDLFETKRLLAKYAGVQSPVWQKPSDEKSFLDKLTSKMYRLFETHFLLPHLK